MHLIDLPDKLEWCTGLKTLIQMNTLRWSHKPWAKYFAAKKNLKLIYEDAYIEQTYKSGYESYQYIKDGGEDEDEVQDEDMYEDE
jgi:hypothetical protein